MQYLIFRFLGTLYQNGPFLSSSFGRMMHVVAWVVDCQHKDVENWNSIVQTSTGPGSVNPHNCLLVSFLFCATFYDYVIILTFLLSLFSPRLLALTKETKKIVSLCLLCETHLLSNHTFLLLDETAKKLLT